MRRSKKSGDKSRANVSSMMPSFMPPIGTEGIASRSSQISEIGVHEQSIGYQRAESTKGPVSRPPSSSNQLGGFDFQLNSFNKSLASFGTNVSAAITGFQRSHFENGGDPNIADHSPRTDTSTDTSADEKNEKE